MGVTFRKTVTLEDGTRLTFSKKGVSVSKKEGNLRMTKTASGKNRVTMTIPKTGISISEEK